MKKIVVILAFVFCSLTSSAQLLHTVDEFLSNRYYRIDYDSTYIGRPLDTKWTLALRTFVDWSAFKVSGVVEGESCKFNLRSAINPRLSIYAGYLGFGASLSWSYKKLIGQIEPDWSFKFNNYGNRFGFEFSLSQINSMNGTLSIPVGSYTVTMLLPRDFASQLSIYANCYFAVNNKKFSYPAAFSHSYIQKHSAGSILLGGSLNLNITIIGDSTEQTEMIRVVNGSLGTGVGYGYNLVLRNNWLIHASVLPYLVIGGGTSYRINDGNEESAAAEFPESFIVGRTAIVHTIDKWFFGATGQINYYNIRCDDIRTGNRQWELMGFVGRRL